MFGSGVAGATNEYTGQTYADAAQAIGQNGQTAVIATRVGSFMLTDKCVVTGSRNANFLDSSGTNTRSGRVLLYLNCNYPFAMAGVPGNSIASPEGRAARADAEAKYAEQQAQAQQSVQDQLLQTGNVPGDPGQVAGG